MKKTKSNKSTPTTRAARIINELNKKHGKGSFVSARDARANVRGYVSTGLPLLNILLSGYASRGWSLGRIYELYGEPDVGKSTLLCMAIARCQNENRGLGCYIDTEGTMTRDRMVSLGVNEDELLICEERWAETIIHQIEDVIVKCKNHPAVVVWDTVASTRSKSHDGAELGRGKRAALAAALSEGLAMLIPTLATSRTVLIACNQKRSGAIDGGRWYTKRQMESTKGGEALKFSANTRVRIEFSGDFYRKVKGEKVHYGFVSRVTASKNKQVPNDVDIKLVFHSKGAGRGRFNSALSFMATFQLWGVVQKRLDTSGRFVFNGEKFTPTTWEKRYNEDKTFREVVHDAAEKFFQETYMGLVYGEEET